MLNLNESIIEDEDIETIIEEMSERQELHCTAMYVELMPVELMIFLYSWLVATLIRRKYGSFELEY